MAAKNTEKSEAINKAVAENAPDKLVDKGKQSSKTKNYGETKAVSIATDMSQVIEWIEEGQTLVFDPASFKELPKTVIEKLDTVSKDNYAWAMERQISRKSPAQRRREEYDREIATLSGNSKGRLEHKARKARRPRKGWHHTWLSPEDWDSWADEAGYRQVKFPGSDDEEIGRETGKPVRIGPEDLPELLLCEIPEEAYQKHLLAISRKSRDRYSMQKTQFAEGVEKLNSDLGLSKENAMTPRDFAENDF